LSAEPYDPDPEKWTNMNLKSEDQMRMKRK
jgi:hypothetical protein